MGSIHGGWQAYLLASVFSSMTIAIISASEGAIAARTDERTFGICRIIVIIVL